MLKELHTKTQGVSSSNQLNSLWPGFFLPREIKLQSSDKKNVCILQKIFDQNSDKKGDNTGFWVVRTYHKIIIECCRTQLIEHASPQTCTSGDSIWELSLILG